MRLLLWGEISRTDEWQPCSFFAVSAILRPCSERPAPTLTGSGWGICWEMTCPSNVRDEGGRRFRPCRSGDRRVQNGGSLQRVTHYGRCGIRLLEACRLRGEATQKQRRIRLQLTRFLWEREIGDCIDLWSIIDLY